MRNPYEMADIDEDADGDVTLPLEYLRRNGMGQTHYNIPADPQPKANQQPPVAPVAPECPPCPECASCPPCDCGPSDGQPRPSPDNVWPLVVGFGLLGAVLWYSGVLATAPLTEYEDEEPRRGLSDPEEEFTDTEVVDSVPEDALAADVEEE